jgi:hypothetical protein
MTHDDQSSDQSPSGEPEEQTHTAEENVSEAAPSGAELQDHGPDAAGHDVHGDQSEHDTHDAHDAHADHGGHDGHEDHDEQEDSGAEKSTLVPVTWRQLIFPALILLIVIILLIGPVSAAFAPKPAQPGEGQPVPTVQPTATPASTPSGSRAQVVSAGPRKSATTVALLPPIQAPKPTQPPAATPTAIDPNVVSPSAAATRTAVAVLGESGQVARSPVQMQFEGAQFTVDAGSGILPDWKPSGDPTHATWIQGTYANQIIYLSYSDSNAALFNKVKPGDTVKLTMDSGQVFEFQVTRSQRAVNGPPTADGQFTVTTAMTQDHAGVTIFLIGDPAPDRAVVQADFNGNIE